MKLLSIKVKPHLTSQMYFVLLTFSSFKIVERELPPLTPVSHVFFKFFIIIIDRYFRQNGREVENPFSKMTVVNFLVTYILSYLQVIV